MAEEEEKQLWLPRIVLITALSREDHMRILRSSNIFCIQLEY